MQDLSRLRVQHLYESSLIAHSNERTVCVESDRVDGGMISRHAKNFTYRVLNSPGADCAILTAGNEGTALPVECQRVNLICLRKLNDRSGQHDDVATQDLFSFLRGISPHRI